MGHHVLGLHYSNARLSFGGYDRGVAGCSTSGVRDGRSAHFVVDPLLNHTFCALYFKESKGWRSKMLMLLNTLLQGIWCLPLYFDLTDIRRHLFLIMICVCQPTCCPFIFIGHGRWAIQKLERRSNFFPLDIDLIYNIFIYGHNSHWTFDSRMFIRLNICILV